MKLTLAEAIPLVHALVGEASAHAGVRAVVIKGLSLEWHGLRRARVPADFDVLLAPSGVDTFIAEMAKTGWRRRLGEFNDFPVPHHSVTIIHDEWPCDVDVHRRFPGFLADPDQVFDILWARHESMPVAGHTVPVADWASSVLILALHSARSTPDNPRHVAELVHLEELAKEWSEAQRADIATLATQTGAAAALEAVLPRLGMAVVVDDNQVDAEALRQWQLRVQGRTSSASTWFRHVLSQPLRRWPAAIRDALWPSEEFLRAGRSIPPGRRALNRVRWQRLANGLLSVPGAALRAAGHGKNVISDASTR